MASAGPGALCREALSAAAHGGASPGNQVAASSGEAGSQNGSGVAFRVFLSVFLLASHVVVLSLLTYLLVSPFTMLYVFHNIFFV